MMTLREEGGVTVLSVSGKLDRKDYEKTIPELEKVLERRHRLSVLLDVTDFQGWTPAALIDELKFDLRHRKDFERIAVVGDGSIPKIGEKLAKPFFTGEVRYFGRDARATAKDWVSGIEPETDREGRVTSS